MVLDATLLGTQHYKMMIKIKVEQSRKCSVVAIERGVLKSPLTEVANFTYIAHPIHEV